MEMGGEQMAKLPENKRQFWGGVDDWLVGGRFGKLVFGKFEPFIEERFKGEPPPSFTTNHYWCRTLLMTNSTG